jgi:hypothetical protein
LSTIVKPTFRSDFAVNHAFDCGAIKRVVA